MICNHHPQLEGVRNTVKLVTDVCAAINSNKSVEPGELSKTLKALEDSLVNRNIRMLERYKKTCFVNFTTFLNLAFDGGLISNSSTMTVNSSYNLDCNKEKIFSGFQNSCLTIPTRLQVKSAIFGSGSSGSSITRHATNKPKRVRINESDRLREEAMKWNKIAIALQCDPEENDEIFMEELLLLCKWSEEYEPQIDELSNFPSRSADNADNEIIIDYDCTHNATPSRKSLVHSVSSTILLQNLRISSTCLKPRTSSHVKPSVNLPNSSRATEDNQPISIDSPALSDSLEQVAFCGIITEDNDSYVEPTVTSIIPVNDTDCLSDDIWTNHNFDF
uniref:NAM-associated domain-containing protein n=1 Tax=Syphacia muris TaxID=451379 RepID=A0A0N5AZE1_9BILA